MLGTLSLSLAILIILFMFFLKRNTLTVHENSIVTRAVIDSDFIMKLAIW